MIIQLENQIKQAKTIEDLKPILVLIVKALNTMDDAKKRVRGDSVYYDGGIVMRCDDGAYHRVTLTLSGGYPAIKIEYVGNNPAGE